MNVQQYAEYLIDGNFIEAERYRRQCIPNVLYKFISLDSDETLNAAKLNTLQENALWFSPADYFNDPCEQKGLFVDSAELKSAGWSPEQIANCHSVFNQAAMAGPICCLSADSHSNMPMWAYYANNSQGYCIECSVNNPDNIYEVSYEEAPSSVTKMTANLLCEIYNTQGKPTPTPNQIQTLMLLKYNSCIKQKKWSHEKEYRIIAPINGSQGIAIPADSCGLTFNKLIIGTCCSEGHTQTLCRIAKQLEIGIFKLVPPSDGSLLPTLEEC